MSSVDSRVLGLIRSQLSRVKVPSLQDKVYKDECVYSFDNPFCNEGLYVSLTSWLGYGKEYVVNAINGNQKLFLHEKWHQIEMKKDVTEQEVTKLAIGVAGGFITENTYDIVKEHKLVVVDDTNNNQLIYIDYPNSNIPEHLSNAIESIINHAGMKISIDSTTWDADQDKFVSKYADKLEQLNTGKKIPQDPSLWKCEKSGDTNNLWLNLSTGYIGGGRKNWDGSGGSGAALEHYNETGCKYPLCVKLGTITSRGGDVWSYAPDEDTLVIDPHLSKHLSHWGIDIMQLEKTDKTLGEMEVDLNNKYDWSKIIGGSGEEMQVISGPKFLGLKNIGSSCYLNSVVQVLAHIPEIESKYFCNREQILRSATSEPYSDFILQFSKVVHGLLGSKYVPENTDAKVDTVSMEENKNSQSTLEKYVMAPRMFKQLVGKGHPEFSTSQQQDASEYFIHLLDFIERHEKNGMQRLGNDPLSTNNLFNFYVENRVQSMTSGQVKYSSRGRDTLNNHLRLQIPLDKAINVDQVNMLQEHKKQRMADGINSTSTDEDIKLIIPGSLCIESYFGNNRNDKVIDGVAHQVLESTRFHTFPRYLMVQLNRYYIGDNWVQVKIDADIPMPENLDLNMYRGRGLQVDEVPFPVAVNATTAPEVTPNMDLVNQLVSMGFLENGCKRAAIATGNSDAEAAMNWLLEHMEDPNLNDPIVSGASAAPSVFIPDSDAVTMITSMGYSNQQATAALKVCNNNLESAMDWIFSHMDDMDIAIAQAMEESPVSKGSVGTTAETCEDVDDGDGNYELISIISHIGKSTGSGHYVCHIKDKSTNQWVLYNDEKVAIATNPPLNYGYMYLYRRL